MFPATIYGIVQVPRKTQKILIYRVNVCSRRIPIELKIDAPIDILYSPGKGVLGKQICHPNGIHTKGLGESAVQANAAAINRNNRLYISSNKRV